MIQIYNLHKFPKLTSIKSKLPNLSDRIFLAAIILGVLLRVIAVIWGDLGPGGDGMGRLANAVAWAERPRWQGLSGVWRPLHWYFLGILIRIWNEPVILAKLINFTCGIGSLIVFRKAVRPLFGDVVASISSLLLAVYWTHIWLTSSYWVEIPYLFLVFLAVHYATKAVSTVNRKAAFLSGLFLTISIFLRHEATLILCLFLIWYGIKTKDRRIILFFAVLPVCAAIWGVIEPGEDGRSFFDYVSITKNMKAYENLLQGFTIKDCLYQWVIMPASVPSVFVIIPGFYGLWRARRLIVQDLFAWMFITQVVFYLFMTLISAWRPQLRYILLYFVNLFPYAALAWYELMKRFSAKPVLLALMAATIVTQSGAWWVGRNHYLPMGWLPIQIRTAPQKALDDWIGSLNGSDLTELKFVSFVYGSASGAWSLPHSMVLNRISLKRCEEFYVAETPGLLQGQLPSSAHVADIVILDPESDFYSKVFEALKESNPGIQVKEIHPRVAALFLSQQSHVLAEISPR